MSDEHDLVLVVDLGAQYAQLIARRVREAHVYSEIVPALHAGRGDAGPQAEGDHPLGWSRVGARGRRAVDRSRRSTSPGVPVFGLCYGAQLVARDLGGEVAKTGRGEYGRTDARRCGEPGVLFREQPAEQVVWMSHFDTITQAPPGFRVLASTGDTPAAAFGDPDRAIYGVQFHPEVAHTERGQEILKAFLFDVAGAGRRGRTSRSSRRPSTRSGRRSGSERVICGLSGGVDSAVAAALVHKAIGDQLTCVFVDTGLLRLNEAEQVEDTFRRQFNVDLVHVKAGDRFLGALDDVVEPERKRKIIGETFIRVFEEVARDHDDAAFLVQGTLYPDIVESGGGDNAVIKSHHNVGGLPEDMDFELVEPLRHLFKDEVRAVGEELGLPEEIVWRQPFPGPGLGGADHRHDHAGAGRDPAAGRRDRRRGDPPGRPLPGDLAELRGAARGADRRRDGRRPHVRVPDHHPRGHERRRDDRRLGPPPVRGARAHLVAGDQRGPGREPRRLRRHLKPPGTIEWE